MTAINEHTGDKLKTKEATEAYRNNWDRIFNKDTLGKKVEKDEQDSPKEEDQCQK